VLPLHHRTVLSRLTMGLWVGSSKRKERPFGDENALN